MQVKEIDGVEVRIEYEDDHVSETISVDYNIADSVEMMEELGITGIGDEENGVSLETNISLLEKLGFKKID